MRKYTCVEDLPIRIDAIAVLIIGYLYVSGIDYIFEHDCGLVKIALAFFWPYIVGLGMVAMIELKGLVIRKTINYLLSEICGKKSEDCGA